VWQARFHDAAGVRRSVYGTSPDECAAKLRGALADRDRGLPHIEGQYTVRTWLADWLPRKIERDQLAPRTAKRYRQFAGYWSADAIGSRRLAQLDAAHIEAALDRWAVRGRSTIVRRQGLILLGAALDEAARRGYAARNVAKLLRLPKYQAPRIDPPTADDVARLRPLIAAHPRREALWLLALDAGLRQGEILGLRWADVDLGAGIVTVRASLGPGKRLGPTKSAAGTRRLPLPATTVAALRRHRDRAVAIGLRPHPTAFVFARDDGKPYGAQVIRDDWHAVCDDAGVRRFRFHDLRHTAATALLARFPMQLVSRYMGHSTIGITVDTYGHLDLAQLSWGADVAPAQDDSTPAVV
jgi:integrase